VRRLNFDLASRKSDGGAAEGSTDQIKRRIGKADEEGWRRSHECFSRGPKCTTRFQHDSIAKLQQSGLQAAYFLRPFSLDLQNIKVALQGRG